MMYLIVITSLGFHDGSGVGPQHGDGIVEQQGAVRVVGVAFSKLFELTTGTLFNPLWFDIRP
jgi:hypothetical protein